MIKKAAILTALFVVLCLGTASLRAEIITIQLTAEVTYLDDLGDLLEGKVHVGDMITGNYSYDSDTPDDNPMNSMGAYWHYTSPYGMNFNVGGFSFQTDPDRVEFVLGITNGTYGDDAYVARSYNNLHLSNGVEVEMIDWQLNDYAGTALYSDVLPTAPPILEDWDLNILDIRFGLNDSSFIWAEVTSAIPEPMTSLFLALGSLLLTRRRQ